jgi:LuxR family maltose regulon positive regulatory protein
MPTPIAPRIILTQNARSDLQALIQAHSTPQSLARRARIVLRAADFDRPTNLAISRELGCNNRTAGKWRRRYADIGLSGWNWPHESLHIWEALSPHPSHRF